MNWKNSTSRYGAAVIVLHWACVELRGLAPRGSELRGALKPLHLPLGLSVFVLARLMHFALYAFMIATPILGWLTLSAEGKPIVLFGLHVPSLVGTNEALADQLQDVHEALAAAGYFLIGLHAMAALARHCVTRDNTLLRMLPGRQ